MSIHTTILHWTVITVAIIVGAVFTSALTGKNIIRLVVPVAIPFWLITIGTELFFRADNALTYTVSVVILFFGVGILFLTLAANYDLER
jgi:hypothetical protein